MTKEKHKKRHELLHRALDELCADWASHQPRGKTFSNSTIMDLIVWSRAQTVDPDGQPPERRPALHEPQPAEDNLRKAMEETLRNWKDR